MIAAMNMLGQGKPFNKAPFFWTNQFVNAQFVGYGFGSDFNFTETRPGVGDAPTGIITYFFKGDSCIGASLCNIMGGAIRYKLALERGLMPTRHELESGSINYEEIGARVASSNPCSKGSGCCRGKR